MYSLTVSREKKEEKKRRKEQQKEKKKKGLKRLNLVSFLPSSEIHLGMSLTSGESNLLNTDHQF